MTEAKGSVPAITIPEAVEDLPRLFEEFSRVTSNLVASHDALLLQVKSLKQELAAKNHRLERKKRLEALGRVAAGVAHEFRNPLGGVRLTVDGLLRGRPSKRSTERLHHIQKAITHLDHIVDELLTFTRTDPLELEAVKTRELVEGAVEIAFPDAAENGISLVVEGPPKATMMVDRHAFSQVLVNLLTNAHQALVGRKGARIGVWWGVRDGQPWIEVADEGLGGPEGEEERIFHPFHSLRDGGIGLGLAIVQSRVEAHDAEISVVHDAWGGGTRWSGARFRLLFLHPREAKDS